MFRDHNEVRKPRPQEMKILEANVSDTWLRLQRELFKCSCVKKGIDFQAYRKEQLGNRY